MSDVVPDLWNDAECAGFAEEELLRYRSNLLGADLRVTNFGGGNTSAKVRTADPLSGEEVDVLWVKGSGGDLGSIQLDGFATLYLDRLLTLERQYRGREHEDEMVGLLPHCTFGLNPRAASIDTPLHAFLPERHIDHLHPDSVIAIAATARSAELTREIFDGQLGWLPWQRPGFDLGLRLRDLHRQHPGISGALLAGHGLITWASTARECYETSLRMINLAQQWLDDAGRGAQPFGPLVREPRAPAERRRVVRSMLPRMRGALSRLERKIGHFDDSDEVLTFVDSERAPELAAMGTSCPDHFLRTKIRPLLIAPPADNEDAAAFAARLDRALADYRNEYAAYYERCRSEESPAMRDPMPVVVLMPEVGMLTFAKDKATARQASEFYRNAIQVMQGASLLDRYVGLDEREAFGIEYWPLEEAKLRRQPPEKRLSRRVAVVTGAAGGIGRATARRLLTERACVVLCDIDGEGLAATREALTAEFGTDVVRSAVTDVTSEDACREAVEHAVLELGGVDVLVCSAGLASSAPFEALSLAEWDKNLAVLTTGYFLVAREVWKVMLEQELGGSIVFIGSKNALAASPQAAAYCSAKAAALHLARCLAVEGAPHGIRVNTVNPDAVLQGSKIWTGRWREERAATYGIAESELEEHYRKRSLLGRNVLPEDVAEAVLFFAADESLNSTGNILNVDAGNSTAFPR